MINKRFYNFMIVLYSDDESYDKQLELLKTYDIIYIIHDKDVTDEGEEKKKHTHLIVRFKNARTISSLSKEIEVGENMIEPIKNLTASLKYLIHYKNDSKFQYSVEECISNCDLIDRLKKITYNDLSEDEKITDLITFIENFDGHIDILIFYKYVASIGMWDILRRSATLILRLIDEHNRKIDELYYVK